jgi:hypothetical protein
MREVDEVVSEGRARGAGWEKRRKNRFFSPTRKKKKTAWTDRCGKEALFRRGVAPAISPDARVNVQCRENEKSESAFAFAAPEKVVGRAAIAPRVLGRGWGSRARLAAAPAGERTWRVLGVRRATAPRAAGRRPPSDVAAGRTTCFACVAAIISFAPGEVAASRRPGAFEDRGLARGRFGDCRSEDASRWFVSRRLGCVEE